MVLAICSFHCGEVVAIPREPVKKDKLVDVDFSDETVRSDVVAMRVVPRESEVTMELAGKEMAFVPP